jgi:hypothetical protein
VQIPAPPKQTNEQKNNINKNIASSENTDGEKSETYINIKHKK